MTTKCGEMYSDLWPYQNRNLYCVILTTRGPLPYSDLFRLMA